MVISHRYKFIFIKTRKTAGTSIEVFLSRVCGENDILTPIYPHVEGHRARNYGEFYNHITAAEIRAAVGETIWQDYFKFCVERNPWDKTLSYYFMQRARSENQLTLADYFSMDDYCTDYKAYTEPSDASRIIVDRVLRYESLSGELAQVFKFLGIAFDGCLGIRAKSEYRTDRRDYKKVLTPAQAKIVGNRFQHEIRLLGYAY